jgi:hypothetical protein
MTTIRIWVYDGIMASGVAGPIDVFNVANHLAAREAASTRTRAALFAWRVESFDGQPVTASSGQRIAVDGKIDARKRADAVLVTAPFFASMDEFVDRREQLAGLSRFDSCSSASSASRVSQTGAPPAGVRTGAVSLNFMFDACPSSGTRSRSTSSSITATRARSGMDSTWNRIARRYRARRSKPCSSLISTRRVRRIRW